MLSIFTWIKEKQKNKNQTSIIDNMSVDILKLHIKYLKS